MAREIERKFLIETDGWQAAASDPQSFRQFYLDRRDGFSVRVRVVDAATAFLTMKTGSGFSRGEYEYEIPLADALELEGARIGNVIEKRRFRLAHGHQVIEIDVFGGVLSPLVFAEIELRSETEAIDLPDWFGREVTDDPAYSNTALAMEGLPKETKA